MGQNNIGHGIIRYDADNHTGLIIACVLGAWCLLVCAFIGGAAYERRQIRGIVEKIGNNTTDAEFIIPEDMPYGNERAMGNCVYGDGLDEWFKLFVRTGAYKVR